MQNKDRMRVVRTIFSDLEDPRSERNKQHLLIDIVIITICAVICGAEGWEDIEVFARAREGWLREFIALPYGVPCHDTIRRVFAALDPKELECAFRRWVRAVFRFTNKQVVAIDGKSLRHSYTDAENKTSSMLHMVSAWAAENGLVLGQIKTADKSNEITAIPELLEILALKGCIITIDAMGAQRDIADKIIAQESDYVLAVKDNQGQLCSAIHAIFEVEHRVDGKGMPVGYDNTLDAGHGRIERRICRTLPATYLPKTIQSSWSGIDSIIMIESWREIKGTPQAEVRYYISSLPSTDAHRLAQSIRQHWLVENQLHWVLDVVFREDDSCIHAGNAAECLAVIRHMALNLCKQEKTPRMSLKKKRYRATLDVTFLEKILHAA